MGSQHEALNWNPYIPAMYPKMQELKECNYVLESKKPILRILLKICTDPVQGPMYFERLA